MYPSEARQETLKRLLNELFPTVQALRTWLLGLSRNNAVRIVDMVPENASNEQFAASLIEKLEALGRVDTEFFLRLLKSFPAREAEIRSHAGHWNVTLKIATADGPPPQRTSSHRAAQAGMILCMGSTLVAFVPHRDSAASEVVEDDLSRPLAAVEQFVAPSVPASSPQEPADLAPPPAVVTPLVVTPAAPHADSPPHSRRPSALVVKRTSDVHKAGPNEKSTALVARLKDLTPGKYTMNLQFKGVAPKGSPSSEIKAALRLCHHPTGKATPLSSLDCLPEHEQRVIRLTGGTQVIDSVPFEVREVAGVTWVVVFTLGEQSEVVHFDLTPKRLEILG